MKFNIRAIGHGSPQQKYEVAIGDFKEVVPLMTNLWDVNAYESQWSEALTALIDERVDRCMLVVDIQPPPISSGITFWVLFREGESIYFQQRFLRERDEGKIRSPISAQQFIAPRLQGTSEDQAQVSEWVLSVEDVREFFSGH